MRPAALNQGAGPMAKSEAVRLLPGGEVSRSARGSEAPFPFGPCVGSETPLRPMAFNGSCSGSERALRPLFLPEPGEEGLGSRRFLRLR